MIGDAKRTVEFAYSWIHNEEREYIQYLAKTQERIMEPLQIERWIPPTTGFVPLTVDGSYDHTRHRMSMGAPHGWVLFETHVELGNLGFALVLLMVIL